jgi:ankyrin repeat protein
MEKAKEMAKTLLSLGATSAQADMTGVTAFHVLVEENAGSLLESLWESDPTGTKTAINHIAFQGYNASNTPLQIAVQEGNLALVLKLLDHGALTHVDFETWYVFICHDSLHLFSCSWNRLAASFTSTIANQRLTDDG